MKYPPSSPMTLPKKLAIIVKGFPRLSETFIAQEIYELEQQGFEMIIFSLRHPHDTHVHDIHKHITSPVIYLPEYLYRAPLEVLSALLHFIPKHQFWKACRLFLKDLRQDISFSRIRRFGQALILAHRYGNQIAHLYAHFIHTPSSVALYAHHLLGVNWSFSAHAKDIWTIPKWELKRKLASASWGVTCTKNNVAYLKEVAPDFPLHHLYHGVNLSQFLTPLKPAQDRTQKGFNLLTVARAVDKKGIDTLILSLALLPRDLNFHWHYIGAGPNFQAYEELAQRLNLSSRVTFHGALTQDRVKEHLSESDLFILPSRVTQDGDRDGLPNVLLEAQAMGVACISTPISGITELIEDQVTGVLIPSDNPTLLAQAILNLHAQPDLRYRLSKAAQAKITQEFSHKSCISPLIDLFKNSSEAA